MLKINTWHGLKTALALPLHPAVRAVLAATQGRLEEFSDQPLNELCTILILEPPDRLVALESELGFPFDPALAEYVDHHDGWFEAVWILSDDGQGFLLMVEDHPDTDQALLAACKAHQTN